MQNPEERRRETVGKGRRRTLTVVIVVVVVLTTFCLNTQQARAQQKIVDRMVATVNGGVRLDLITYSDLLWQLALQPGTPLANPRSEDLNAALQSLINQRLILQEAEKLPAIAPSDEDVRAAISDLVKQFPSSADFIERLRMVGFQSIDDEQFKEIIRRRVVISNYLNFRFRSFTIVTPQEEANYYTQDWVPRFKRQHPNTIVPTLEKARAEINQTLTENKIESETDAFLDSSRENAEIIILSPV